MKKILILISFLSSFVFSETFIMSNYCCYSLDTHGDNIVWDNTIVGSGRYSTNQSVWESELNSQGYNTAPLCVGRGVMESYSLINGTDTIDNGDNTYTQVFDIQKTHKEYECTCSSPDTNKTDLNTTLFSVIYDGEASEAPSECYEPNDPIYNELYQIDCVVMMQCWTPIKPPFDCSSKGEGWVYNSDDTAEGCSSWVGNGDIDGASFEEGSEISPTCCLHYENDENTTAIDENTTVTDENTTDDNTTDDNTTIPDVTFDEEQINDSINQGNTINHSDNQQINDSINQGNEQQHLDSEAIKSELNSNAEQEHQDNTDIKDAINDFSDRNHEDLGDIKESIDNLKDDNLSNPDSNGLTKIGNDLGAIMGNAYTTIPQKFNSLMNYSFGSVPVFSHSSGTCVFSANTATMGTITIDLNEYVNMMKPFTQTMFSLLFIWISLSWWWKSFKILLKVVIV